MERRRPDIHDSCWHTGSLQQNQFLSVTLFNYKLSLLFDCYPFWDLSDLLTKAAPYPFITGKGENPAPAARMREKNVFTARRTIVVSCVRHSKSSPLSQPDMETQRLLSPPGAGILSSWKTSSSAFLGHHSISQSPCRISFWHPTKQSKKV